ncbi:GrBNV gp43-like protein [Tomelloso virus]|uniref:GrBNV gp43-like protein n=1 Tax=Tomelloso virus TaxID=2053981 RepID=A0A2H4T2Q2_9VIRU|nr:GrBNV gp43-like protein [Tomelloso virus]ATY70211.1 GrBNV gp43-like protein [Tomelloso virus]
MVHFQAQPAAIYKYLQSQPPLLEPSEVNHPSIKYIFNEKHANCNNTVPNIAELISKSTCAQKFGRFNEIEYSANIKFKNVIIPASVGTKSKIRYYINDFVDLYYNDEQVSTEYFENSTLEVGTLCTRLDYLVSDGSLDLITSKLKLVRSKFNYDGVTYSLTGSIEIDFPEMKEKLLGQPTPIKYSKKRQFIYWNLSLILDEDEYIFRIAFRNLHRDNVECNIECEDLINGGNFILCFDLLSKYYKRQYIAQNSYIYPLADLDPLSMKLTPEQREILKTFKLVDNPDQHDEYEQIVPDNVVNFVKFTSLQSLYTNMNTDLLLPLEKYSTLDTDENFNSSVLDDVSNDDMF